MLFYSFSKPLPLMFTQHRQSQSRSQAKFLATKATKLQPITPQVRITRTAMRCIKANQIKSLLCLALCSFFLLDSTNNNTADPQYLWIQYPPIWLSIGSEPTDRPTASLPGVIEAELWLHLGGCLKASEVTCDLCGPQKSPALGGFIEWGWTPNLHIWRPVVFRICRGSWNRTPNEDLPCNMALCRT